VRFSLLANAGLLIGNAVVGLLYFFSGGDVGGTFALALLYFLIFTPASFLCWFRPVYKAFRDDSSFNFMVFFFVFFFQFIVSVFSFLGIGNTGSWYGRKALKQTLSPILAASLPA